MEFAYNNRKNANIGHICFEFNCGYHFCVFFKDKFNSYSKFYLANKLVKELRNLVLIY